eukprot:6470750-Amphidinium_carterae.1
MEQNQRSVPSLIAFGCAKQPERHNQLLVRINCSSSDWLLLSAAQYPGPTQMVVWVFCAGRAVPLVDILRIKAGSFFV